MGNPKRVSASGVTGLSPAHPFTQTFAADDVNERHMMALKGAI